jgi:hypothetical protein
MSLHPWDELERVVAADRAKPEQRGSLAVWLGPAALLCSLLWIGSDYVLSTRPVTTAPTVVLKTSEPCYVAVTADAGVYYYTCLMP